MADIVMEIKVELVVLEEVLMVDLVLLVREDQMEEIVLRHGMMPIIHLQVLIIGLLIIVLLHQGKDQQLKNLGSLVEHFMLAAVVVVLKKIIIKTKTVIQEYNQDMVVMAAAEEVRVVSMPQVVEILQ